MQIVVINLHPALLTNKSEESVSTSRGIIPILRGAQAIKDAYSQNLPVSGVTIYQVVPENPYDVGSIIVKEEVRREDNETLESFEKKIHITEHRALPTAIKKIIHVLSFNIDTSKGDFPW
jgi:phosphoribosylglycinamide formyltransferase-1